MKHRRRLKFRVPVPKSATRLREDQLHRAAFTVGRREVRRRGAIRRMLVGHGRSASVLYYFDKGLSPQPLWEQG